MAEAGQGVSVCAGAWRYCTALLSLVVLSGCVHGVMWDHEEFSDTGPPAWPRLFPACGGARQSPVDVARASVRFSSSLISFELPGYETIPRGAHWELLNTGHGLQIQLNGEYRMREGGLPGSYRAVHMDLHWGSSDQQGSEHSINGTHFPLELQVLHYNTKYGSFDEAVSEEDGLAAFAFFFKITEHDNPIYTQIINKLEKVVYQGQQVTLRPVPLLSLLPINLNNYYRYEGSLTQPPCSETITWTLFTDLVDISARQLQLIRSSLRANQAPPSHDQGAAPSRLSTNHRASQTLGGRVVYSSMLADSTFWTAPLSPISITLAALLGFVVLFLVLGRSGQGGEGGEGEGGYRGGGGDESDLDGHLD